MTWMGSWACHLRQGTPRPQQGIFSCRLHSCLGLSVSHTHSVRSTFLSGSLPAPGAGTHQPTGTCGVPAGWLATREEGRPPERRACGSAGLYFASWGWDMRGQPQGKGWTWADLQSLPSRSVILTDRPPLCPLTSSILSLTQARQAGSHTCSHAHTHDLASS